MDDERVWGSEEGLWVGDADNYRRAVDSECLMALPATPHIVNGEQAAAAVASTPRWATADLTERHVSRPQEGLIVIAYRVRAERADVRPYEAHCTTTYRRLDHDHWQVVQHQQTPVLTTS